jgi:O-6-methylguanine DNA methyltransferase
MNLPDHECWATGRTPVGWVGIRLSQKGLSCVVLPQQTEALTVQRLTDDNLGSPPRDQRAAEPWIAALQAALRGEPQDFRGWPLDLARSTPFQRACWQAAQQIPWGQTRSYWWVAVRAGDPHSARAVGQAMGANPIPLVVPCHRVVRSDGSLGGFGGGQELKRRLLEIEGTFAVQASACIPAQQQTDLIDSLTR